MQTELPQEVLKAVRIEHTYEHIARGWYPVDSIIPDHCFPTYRNVGGGVTDSMLRPLPQALDACIASVEDRIKNAQRHLQRLKTARASLNTGESQ